MRLSTIKLAGFKSFVDPTVLHLPTNLTGVVGPNGCGKSNIIDAVRWVMGESAASRLRGDALTDVIFNGSSGRKPVGQATVELIFDNSDGFIGGEFAAYAEISVRRLVSRDGQSNYYLNQSRCRRRDITDLFLGTGLGPRSYSIIEQGMVSQIVESAPEDLRVHLEEAAGISKYKERRKETESRMRATRENLARLNDVREEVDKHLLNLERQARQAERYTELKAEQARVRAEFNALSWAKLDTERQAVESGLKQSELELERLAAARTRIECEEAAARLQHQDAADQLHSLQAQSYQVGANIARTEQELKFRRDSTARSQRELAELNSQDSQLAEQLDADQRQALQLEDALAIDAPQLQELAELNERNAETLQAAEAAQSAWQQRFAECSQRAALASKQAEVERTRIELLERQTLDKLKRGDALSQERALFNIDALRDDLLRIEQDGASEQDALAQLNSILEHCKASLAQQQQSLTTCQAALRQSQQQSDASAARLVSLEALQHAALGQDKKELNRWLSARGLEHAPRLGEVLQVQPGWERAVEVVLDGLLEAVVVPDLHSLEAGDLPGGILSACTDTPFDASAPVDSLASKVTGPSALRHWLGAVLLAEDIGAARTLVAELAPHQSLITADGQWLARDWLRLVGKGQAHDGIVARTRAISELRAKIETLNELSAAQRETVDGAKSALFDAERARDDAQLTLHAQHRKTAENAGKLTTARGRADNAKVRMERIVGELSGLQQQLESEATQVREARARMQEATERMGGLEDERNALDAQQVQLKSALERARASAREARERAHQLELNVLSKRNALQSLRAAIVRITAQRAAMVGRQELLAAQLSEAQAPLAGLQDALTEGLEQRLSVERGITGARNNLDERIEILRKLDVERQRTEQLLEAAREARSQGQLKTQSLSIREEGFLQAIEASGFARATLLAEMPEGAKIPLMESRAAELEVRIRRLEPVNLAAIKELEETRQRKTYLDAQNNDLTTALDTLEEAIKKIDRETRTRFKDTFEQVNAGFQQLFPRLFGGGHAALELTGADLLETGVNIIARPPGKRPASINLLSGGEKALTAVALIFAIFRLNPAPFCLLDEVDAPLDEANVGRFCKLVEDMSSTVQFIFVSHNKVTMEAARQLAGVTMREPGVSRLVSVDLEQAAQLVGA